MTTDEAKKVLAIMDTADGGCPHCAKNLYEKFLESFPEHRNLVFAEYPSLVGDE